MLETKITPHNNLTDETLLRAHNVLSDGGLVALPTETVYGLAADATNGEAVARIFQAKGRPQFNPLICHVSDLAMAETFAHFDHDTRILAKAFWPGPLTLILPFKKNHNIHPLVSAGLKSVGVRLPMGMSAQLIAHYGKPLAAPSANRSGKISPTTAQAVTDDLGHAVDFIIDDGPCGIGLESTIIKLEDHTITILRPGAITADDFKQFEHLKVSTASPNSAIEAPGMLQSHYAPNAQMRLMADYVEPNEALLAFGPHRIDGAQSAQAIENLSPSGDLIEAAANLFSMMAKLDTVGAQRIAVEPIPNKNIGIAINDRLMRAAAPRGTAHA